MSVFYAFVTRLKYIGRWGLMRNTRTENVLEHSAVVAMFAHAVAVLHNKFGGNVNPDRVGMMALFHETGEVITGDMPTPVKYFNGSITSAYKEIERQSESKLVSTLTDEVKDEVGELVLGGSETERRLVKYADTLAAYVKCIEETAQGNGEFGEALVSTEKKLRDYHSREVDYFIENFVTPFGASLDKLGAALESGEK